MKRTFRINFLIAIAVILATHARAQFIPHHTDNEDIYNYLSELRIKGIVDYNPAVLPLSRKEIAEMLWRADSSEQLNKVQREELDFWKQEFGKDIGTGKVHRTGKFFKRRTFDDHDVKKRLDLFYFANDLFQVTVNPVGHITGRVNTGGDFTRYQSWGGEVFGRIGKGFGFYFIAKDYLEQPNWNGLPYRSPELGGVYRGSITAQKGIEYFDIRGGVTYGWKWGQVGIIKDHLQLGSTFSDNIILSKRAPSFPRFHLQLKPVKWAELTYTFGWLNSDIVDSTRSYLTTNNVYREVYHSKFYVSNMITVRPWKYLTFSLGSSVIFADNNFNAGHFIPIMFYTALDANFTSQNNNAGQNSQIFADLNFDLFSWGRIFGSIFIDEIRFADMFDSDKQRNTLAYQVGLESRPFTSWNLKLQSSYTRIRPGVYSHYIPTTSFAHARYGMGHFLGENADALNVNIQFRPIKKLRVIVQYQRWRKGEEVVFDNTPRALTGTQFLTGTKSEVDRYSVRVSYQIINGVRAQLVIDHLSGGTDGTYPLWGVNDQNVSDTWFGFGLSVGR